jgi:hypothetical protein
VKWARDLGIRSLGGSKGGACKDPSIAIKRSLKFEISLSLLPRSNQKVNIYFPRLSCCNLLTPALGFVDEFSTSCYATLWMPAVNYKHRRKLWNFESTEYNY